MDEKRLIELIERIVSDFKEELMGASVLTKAYFILPQDWQIQDQGHCIETMQALKGRYQLVVVHPDEGDGKAAFPSEDFITVFPLPSRNLVIKAALGIQDDFESKWVAKCISYGRAVYMRSEAALFVGKEPDSYRKKIEAYYNDVRSYGIQFDTIPNGCNHSQGTDITRMPQKKKIVTADDLKKLHPAKELRLCQGDIVTALAAELAETLGISILYQ